MRHGADPSLEEDDGRSISQLAREEGVDPAILAVFDADFAPRSGLASHESSRAASGTGTGSAEANPLRRRSGGGSAARGAAGPSPLRQGGGSPACASPASSRHGSESHTKGRTPTRAAVAAERGGEVAAESSLSSGWGAALSVSAVMEGQLQSSVES